MPQKSIKILSKIIKVGIFILPVMFFIVSGSMFFPFITGKNFFFRIVVELIFVLWATLALIDKKYRPTISPVFYAVTITTVILILSTIFGENPYRSFWSNYERMEGLVGHLHLFAYFLIVISMFKREVDWKRYLNALLTYSFLIASYGYLQKFGILETHQSGTRLDATLGNSAYMGAFMIFSLFLALMMFLSNRGSRIKYIYAFLFIFDLPILYYTETRGSILGFLGGAFIFGFLLAILSKEKIYRRAAFGVLGLLIILVGLFFVFKESAFVQESLPLRRLASISLTETTVESRFTIWGMAFEGLKERPVLGWGLENFNLVFNEYFKPILWKQEPWFDRAHNVFLDWMTSGGVFGLLAYLSIFGSALYILWKEYFAKAKRFAVDLAYPVALTSLLAAYFFHNIFVFDNLTSYFLFFSVLGFAHSRYKSADTPEDDMQKKQKYQPLDISFFKMLVITAVFICIVFSMYFVNIKPILTARELLAAIRQMSIDSSDTNLVLEHFDKAISYNTFGNVEAREQLAGYAVNVARNQNIPQEKRQEVLNRAISEMRIQTEHMSKDAREFLFLAAVYNAAGRPQEALDTAKKALSLSPNKQQISLMIADAHLSMGQNQDAFNVVKRAYELDEENIDVAKSLAAIAVLIRETDYSRELLQKHFKSPLIADAKLMNTYANIGDFNSVVEILFMFLEKEPANIDYRLKLAGAYLQLGERELSVQELELIKEINPQLIPQADYYISEIKAGRNP